MIAAERTIAPAAALRTLLYLDAHILLNRIRTAARNPLRLVFWLLFLLVIVSSLQARTMMNEAIRSRPAPPPGAGPLPMFFDPTPWLHAAATFVPGVILIVYGVFTIGSSRQSLPAFRSAADARFLIGSALPPRLVVLWLVVRVILSLSWRIPLMLYFFIFILPTSLGVSGSTGLRIFLALLLLTTTVALNLPIFISRQRQIGPNPVLFGWLFVLTGLASLVVVFVALSPAPPSLVSTLHPVAASLPPGSWLVGAFEGNGLGLVALAALATGSLLLTSLVAGDVYPELWSSSARVIVLRRAVRRRGPFMTRGEQRRLLTEAGIGEPARSKRQTSASSGRGRWVPSGAWTILWKEWLATRRVAGGMRLPAIALLVAVVVGAAIGTLGRSRPEVAGFLLGPLVYAVVMISLFTAYRRCLDVGDQCHGARHLCDSPGHFRYARPGWMPASHRALHHADPDRDRGRRRRHRNREWHGKPRGGGHHGAGRGMAAGTVRGVAARWQWPGVRPGRTPLAPLAHRLRLASEGRRVYRARFPSP